MNRTCRLYLRGLIGITAVAGIFTASIGFNAPARADSVRAEVDRICQLVAATDDIEEVKRIRKYSVDEPILRLEKEGVKDKIKTLNSEIETHKSDVGRIQRTVTSKMRKAKTRHSRALKKANDKLPELIGKRDEAKEGLEDFEWDNRELKEQNESLSNAGVQTLKILKKFENDKFFWSQIEKIKNETPTEYNVKRVMDETQAAAQDYYDKVKAKFKIKTSYPNAFASLTTWKKSWRWGRVEHAKKLLAALKESRFELAPYFAQIKGPWQRYEIRKAELETKLSEAKAEFKNTDALVKTLRKLVRVLETEDIGQLMTHLKKELKDADALPVISEMKSAYTKDHASLVELIQKIKKKKSDVEDLEKKVRFAEGVSAGTQDCIAKRIAALTDKPKPKPKAMGEMTGQWLLCCNRLKRPRSEPGKNKSKYCRKYRYGYLGRFRIRVENDRSVVGKYSRDKGIGDMVLLGRTYGKMSGSLSTHHELKVDMIYGKKLKHRMTGHVSFSGSTITGTGNIESLAAKKCRGKWTANLRTQQSQTNRPDRAEPRRRRERLIPARPAIPDPNEATRILRQGQRPDQIRPLRDGSGAVDPNAILRGD